MTSPSERRAHVIGLGLIGSSVALALGNAGWRVSGQDRDEKVEAAALQANVIERVDGFDQSELVVVATPAGRVASVARDLLARQDAEDLLVTDVAGVKSAIVKSVVDRRFLGGHPMAGSERRGLAGARGDLFEGCTWVLTPTSATTAETYGRLHGVLRELGANVVAVDADSHDRLVAVASHVPHLLAGALMNEATRVAQQDAVLLQLAAGGFRDMTRVAAGDPAIWPDVLFENRDAVVQSLGALEARIADLRHIINEGRRDELTSALLEAAQARRQLPGRALDASHLAFLRVDVSDEPGVLARVTTAASEMLVNIYDIEIAHGIEGKSGTLLLSVDAAQVELFTNALHLMGFRASIE